MQRVRRVVLVNHDLAAAEGPPARELEHLPYLLGRYSFEQSPLHDAIFRYRRGVCNFDRLTGCVAVLTVGMSCR
jgi:hypothetical protein